MTKSPPKEDIPQWQSIAQGKKADRDAKIRWRLKPGEISDDQLNVINVPYQCGLLTTREQEITDLNAYCLIENITDRKYSSYEVTLAFCKRAAIAQQLVNCLSEIFFEEALDAAKKLDDEFEKSGIPRGPLHGLPISLKDCFQIENTDAAIGYTALVDQPSSKQDESEITRIMRESGAILFCKTNVPTALMSGETFNSIYGYTSNPFNRNLSSGGSSGGESALLALHGSPLGVGTDIGGSIRIPASFCGFYSLKPSFGRFPTVGIRDSLNGQEAVRNTVGPMAHSLMDIEIWCKTVVNSQPHISADPECLPIPWRKPQIPQKLCFGFLLDDGIVKPLPPVTAALLRLKTILQAAGHDVIEFGIDDPMFLDSLRFPLYQSAAAKRLEETLSLTNEPWPRGYELLENMTKDKNIVPATVSELWEAQVQRTEYCKKVLRKWADTKNYTGTGREIDGLIMPCSPWPASSKHGFIYDNYTSIWNILDYPAITMPMMDESSERHTNWDYQPRNELESRIWADYSSEETAGLPVSVQVVGRRLSEEYLLGVANAVDSSLKLKNPCDIPLARN